MPEATATESEITMALLGDNQDLSIYNCRSSFTDLLKKGTISTQK